jgi:phosphatidylglycerol---prolipoprotein diacylglyceryl transferase
MFLVGVVLGYAVLRQTYASLAAGERPTLLPLRYAVCVYLCALGAQFFAYAFDANTSLVPPEGNWLSYYFNPVGGPKTLYGAILLLPIAVAVSMPTADFRVTLDRLMPALMTILSFARLGCFLQGCCYGLRSELLGISFPPGSLVHADQVHARLITIGDWSLPTVPTQLACAVACAILAVWSYRALSAGERSVFARGLVGYSAFRFLVEIIRADEARNHFLALSTSQWIALGVMVLVAMRSVVRREPAS